jgi:hypothetical protein
LFGQFNHGNLLAASSYPTKGGQAARNISPPAVIWEQDCPKTAGRGQLAKWQTGLGNRSFSVIFCNFHSAKRVVPFGTMANRRPQNLGNSLPTALEPTRAHPENNPFDTSCHSDRLPAHYVQTWQEASIERLHRYLRNYLKKLHFRHTFRSGTPLAFSHRTRCFV